MQSGGENWYKGVKGLKDVCMIILLSWGDFGCRVQAVENSAFWFITWPFFLFLTAFQNISEIIIYVAQSIL